MNTYRASEATLVGDVLLCAAFISYIGPFTKRYRLELIQKQWLPFIQEKKIPISEGIDPLQLLTDDAQIAQWNNEVGCVRVWNVWEVGCAGRKRVLVDVFVIPELSFSM